MTMILVLEGISKHADMIRAHLETAGLVYTSQFPDDRGEKGLNHEQGE